MAKVCITCKKEKSLDSFNKNKSMIDGLHYTCRTCSSILKKKNYKKHKEKICAKGKLYYKNNREKALQKAREYNKSHKQSIRGYHLKHYYNITLEQYDVMFEIQNGVCVICGPPELMRRLSVDHCHETGKIRGLLCQRCNRAIGLMEDNVQNLHNAIKYLDKKDESCLQA